MQEPTLYAISRAVTHWVATLLLIVVTVIYMRPLPAAVSSPAPAAAAAVRIHAGCVIRGDGGWHIHANATHFCGALSGVHVEADGDLVLELRSAAYGATAVEDQDIRTDETFSRFADCGASGGLGTTTVRCWDKDSPGHLIRAQDPRWDTPLGNLWFSVDWVAPATPTT